MSDQRRIVLSDTPRWRAASEVERPRRLVGTVCAVMRRIYGRCTREERSLRGFAEVWPPWSGVFRTFARFRREGARVGARTEGPRRGAKIGRASCRERGRVGV